MNPDPRSGLRPAMSWRAVRDRAFAVCTVWLVVQNAALLAVNLSGRHPAALAAAGTLARATLATLLPLLAIGTALLLGCLFAGVHARQARRDERARAWERRHG